MSCIERVDLRLDDGEGRQCVFETDHLQIMRARLAPGEAVPHHTSNSNVLLVPIQGTVGLAVPDRDETFGVGEAMAVPYGTPMDVRNAGDGVAIFLIVKAPHPNRFK